MRVFFILFIDQSVKVFFYIPKYTSVKVPCPINLKSRNRLIPLFLGRKFFSPEVLLPVLFPLTLNANFDGEVFFDFQKPASGLGD